MTQLAILVSLTVRIVHLSADLFITEWSLRMRRFVGRTLVAAAVGVGTGFLVSALAAAILRVFPGAESAMMPVCKVLIGPLNRLAELDQKRHWGVLYEDPIACFLLLGVYWALLGELCFWSWTGARRIVAVWSTRNRSRPGEE